MGHWDAVLAELIEERKKLDGLIELATERAGRGGGISGTDTPTAIRSDTFFGMKAPEAIRRYLAMVKAPKSPAEIAEALKRGGYTTTSTDLPNTLRTALRRMEDEDVVQVGSDWGLADWYPGRARTKKAKGNGESETTTPPADATEPEQPA